MISTSSASPLFAFPPRSRYNLASNLASLRFTSLANSVEIDSSPDPQPPIRPWSSLLIRDYRLLWIASVLSSLAGQIRNVATLYQVYDISGSAFKLGLTGFLETLPFIIFGLFAGAVADAFDRKKLLIATISLQLVPNLLLGLLTLTGAIEVWHIYALGLVGAFVEVCAGQR